MTLDVYSPIEQVQTQFLNEAGVYLDIKRDDKIHPFISGNKWRKLKYNIQAFHASGKKSILTFGGAFSNHLIATAAACAKFKIPCIGLVRGEELTSNSNLVLRLCEEFGMKLKFVTRADYRLKTFWDETTFVIPEGGDNSYGINGCEEILMDIVESYNHIVVSVGTATTFKGIINGAKGKGKIHGIAALKGADYLKSEIHDSVHYDNWTLHTKFSGTGFGKYTDENIKFNKKFTQETGVLLDPIYTGKTMYAIYQLIAAGDIARDDKVLFIHTGGLTGILSDKWLTT